ncbi:HesB/YadR/YfhF family protein [Paenibacillus pini]|uniref:FeS cluster biogenesis domain-containing protein n=1 Tax=Paenibacillus pini JCM 16418 TaxID=1236976 RepID=W7YJQ0_9BACL|nr:hypothetical protein [Paenibacillus pini]GAF07918.1 hypothetical protein JCM16418_1951 [Paenibacillus pini JCM 16418]
MNIRISKDAARWYIKELGLQEGSFLRFFPRYSSGGGLHPGFSLGISEEPAERPFLQENVEGVNFYMEEQDVWYLREYDLVVNYLQTYDDIDYVYEPEQLNSSAEVK